MVGNSKTEIWLTYALTEVDVSKALTLCLSLRKVLTTRKIGVIVSRTLSDSLKESLYYGFDFFFYLEEEHNRAGLDEKDFVKLFVLRLKSFEKCVFLNPTMLVLKNCDEIFDEYDAPPGIRCGRTDNRPMFVVRPSPKIFKDLMTSICVTDQINVDRVLKNWSIIQGEKLIDKEKYNVFLSSSSGTANVNPREVAIVDVADELTLDINLDDFGLFSNLILNYRNELYNETLKWLSHSEQNGYDNYLGGGEWSQPSENEPIAIIGMSCRYPNANNLEEFWHLLLNGKDGTGKPPQFRWLRNLLHKDESEHREMNAGFLHYKVEEFDAKFFGISPLEMEYLDPQTRLLHELVWEGLEDAAVNPQRLRGTNGGVFTGSWTNDYKDLLTLSGDDDFYRKYMGNSIGSAAARISFLLGMTGPSIATESGCSSAMVAVHLACKSLLRKETNFALACGVNLLLRPFNHEMLPAVLSPDGLCKTFDATANGFSRAEGCGVLVLKRLADAVRDGDKIWALIKGSGISQEGLSKSMGTPTIHSETLAMQMALEDANVKPEQVSYVEAHGTGTPVGDPMEVAAIAKVYHSNERKVPLMIGSVKTNVGHTESCSGITGIMKVVLGMQHEIIPPHRNFETLNPAINLDAVPATIPLKPVEWQREVGRPRYAGVSSFGITGTDAHAIIQESPSLHRRAFETNCLERPLHIMKITAKTEDALDILIERYKSHLQTDNESHIGDMAFTANVGRADFSHRAVIIANSKQAAVQKIESKKFMRAETSNDGIGKICFLFTGQGSQYPGMARQLYETSPVFRMHFEYCESILKKSYNIDITKVLWSSNGDIKEVSRTIYSQTSIFCIEYALMKLWESWGIKPDFVLGHSLGEFPAAVCAGILTVEDAIKLVAERSRLIDQLPHGNMLVIKADKRRVDALLKEFAGNDKAKLLDLAAINSDDQTVIAGDTELVLQFGEMCTQENIKCVLLDATHAFHSKHMDPILDEYKNVAETLTKMKGNNIKFISGTRGSLIEIDQIDSEYWVQHTREGVLFLEASKKAVELGCEIFIEIGPQPVLSALTMKNNSSKSKLVCLPSLRKNENEWETMLNTLGKLYLNGVDINWEGFDQFYKRNKVRLPHYPFIGKRYWPDMSANFSVTIHPLLGSVIPNASSSNLFQSSLSSKNLEWIKDHVIGNHIIFPGAGYLEMCLAAGLATINSSTDSSSSPTRPMKVENLCIEAPLSFPDSTSSQQVQTVAELNEENDDGSYINIKICKRVDSELESSANTWRCHAKATFSPAVDVEDKLIPQFSLSTFLEVLKLPFDEDTTAITQMYDKLAAAGLKFGPSFKSIQSLRRDRKQGTVVMKLEVKPEQHSQLKYIIHPVILDSMIQAIMILDFDPNSFTKKTLHIPIKIGKFVWLSGMESSSQLFIYAYHQETRTGDNRSALLVDCEGKMIAIMSSVVLIETCVKAVEAVLETQTSCLPQFWEEVWKPTPSLSHHDTDMECGAGKFFSEQFHSDFEQKFNNNPNPDLVETYRRLEKLIYLNFLRGLFELGWKPEENFNKVFSEDCIFNELGIRPSFRQYFSFICEVLNDEGILEKVKGREGEILWKIINTPPSNQIVFDMLASFELTSELSQRFQPTGLLSKVGESLKNLLTGSVTPISILFPEEGSRTSKSYPSIAEFYYHTEQVFQLTKLRDMMKLMLSQIRISQPNPDFKLRILEIGAGTGFYSQKFLEQLEALDLRFEYTYTDISTSFFPAAQERFERYNNSMKFSRLNIEEDPLEQGFIPGYFDLVIAAEIIHATRDIAETLRNIHILMKPWGRLSIHETTRVNRLLTFLFGTLDGYWRFQDKTLRPKHCTLDKKKWAQVLSTCDFGVEGIFSVFNNFQSYIVAQKTPKTQLSRALKNDNFCFTMNKVWLLFHQSYDPISTHLSNKLGMVDGRTLITITSGCSFQVDEVNNSFTVRKTNYEDFVTLLDHFGGRFIEGIVYCWSLDDAITEQEEVLQPYFNLTKSLLTLNLKVTPRLVLITRGAVPFIHGDNELTCIQASTLWGYTKSLKNEYFNLNCRAIEVADGRVDEGRLQDIFYEIWNSDKESQVAFSGHSRFVPRFEARKVKNSELKLPSGSTRFQLILPESKSISDLQFGPLEPTILGEEEVEVQIKASALNFRDVLSVIKPSEQFKDINGVGLDFAGVIQRIGKNVTRWKIGDRVFGFNPSTPFPSHVKLDQNLLLSLPNSITFCDGATIPAVYITSIVCLLEVAKIKRDDVVLIHTASGGVGLSAIQICKHVGCTVIATAGSKRKQIYLKNLGIEHIFHSRNTRYGDQILALTKGRGVDVVLNSLTSEGFKEATLKACATGARFVEMSKLNIWTEEQVRELRPDVEYRIVDVSSIDACETRRLLDDLKSLFEKNVVKPIPYVRFDGLNIRGALYYMQQAKHVGKIVCVMPEMRKVGGEFKIESPMFSSNATYLITGGLGGIGFVVCQWMVEKGANHIILAGRNPPSTSIQNKIRDLNLQGSHVHPVQLDVGSFEDCKKLLQITMVEMDLPPLKGVMHAAGTLANTALADLDWKTLSSTFPPKINGTLNLHELTKSLDLEHFVLFSSMAALFGTPGQYNHAAANIFEDAFAHYRNSIGLPATTVNWGVWGQVGVAKDMDVPGVKAISNLQALAGLEYVMKTQQLQSTITNMGSFVLFSKIVPQVSVYVDDQVWKASLKQTSSAVIKANEFWRLYDNLGENTEEKFKLLKNQLQITLRNILRLGEREVIEDNANFQDIGVDSLMFVEIKNSVQSLLGERLVIRAASIKDCNTVKTLAETLLKLIEGEEAENSKPTLEQVSRLIKEDCYLPEHISAMECPPIVALADVKTVLVTGCTGTLGPYVLKELTQLPQITRVICLIRPRKTDSLESYLIKILQETGLAVDMSKLRLVAGNIAQPHLGLEKAMWEELSVDVDAIFHCAACVQHTEQYVARNSTTDARAVNIGGMKNLLELACTTKLKYVYSASSLLAVFTLDDSGKLSEGWPEAGEYDGITTHAYPISKYVCDMLTKQAVERGIPCKVFRFPLIVGESTTGRCSLERNHALLRYVFIMKNGVIPSTPLLLPMLPVDICADVSVKLFFRDNEGFSDIYNVSHGEAEADHEFVNVAAKFGHTVNIVEYSEFANRVQNSVTGNQSSALALFEDFYDEDAIMRMYQNAPSLRKWLEEGGEAKEMWLSKKIQEAMPTFYENQKGTMEYVYKDLCYCKSQGWFEKYGL